MKKNSLYILLDLVFLMVFNTVFFVAGGTDHIASVWISYGFIHFAYLMILITPFLIRKSSSIAVLGFSIYSISVVYFFLEFIVGLIFIFVGSDTYKSALIVQVIIAGIYAVLLISNLIANEHTMDSVEKHKNEIAYIKNASSRVKMLVGKATDKKINKEIERVYDLLHSSPVKTTDAVRTIEDSIIDKVTELENMISVQDGTVIIAITNELIYLIEERNRKIRMSN